MLKIAVIAAVAHEINRAYCAALGDDSQPAWEDAPGWQRESAVSGVGFHLANPGASASASHDAWSAQKVAGGWTYGKKKDPEAKTHPCLVPFEKLPPEQRAKDYLFRAVVHQLAAIEPERVEVLPEPEKADSGRPPVPPHRDAADIARQAETEAQARRDAKYPRSAT